MKSSRRWQKIDFFPQKRNCLRPSPQNVFSYKKKSDGHADQNSVGHKDIAVAVKQSKPFDEHTGYCRGKKRQTGLHGGVAQGWPAS
jgi:hypothetical protein